MDWAQRESAQKALGEFGDMSGFHRYRSASGAHGRESLMKDGKFTRRLGTRDKLLKQATDQVRVANGVPIGWHVAELRAADAMRALLEAEEIIGVTVHHTPVIHKRAGQ